MPVRTLLVDGAEWQVAPAGRLTAQHGDEVSITFSRRTPQGDREVRVTRFTPMGARAREAALQALDDETLRRLFDASQPGERSPEAGYRP
jgi:hypothetical protein